MMPKLNIRPGDRYGMLTIVKELESYKRPSGGTIRHFRCKCDCGNETEVLFSSLRSGLTVSCGCYLRKRSREQMTRHGMKGTRIYNIYRGIKQRCLNPKNQHYPLYGGRGIRMCNEWANSPEAFFKWAFANGYTENLTLDRIDVNGDYEHGKEVFEGDVLEADYKYDQLGYNGGVDPDNDCICYGVVEFDNDALQWVLNIHKAEYPISKQIEENECSLIPLQIFGHEYGYDNCNLKIIGNIHDNPSLINDKQ